MDIDKEEPLVIFQFLPIPPSSNNQYAHVPIPSRDPRAKPRMKMVSTRDLKTYKDEMTKWAMMNSLTVSNARRVCMENLMQDKFFHIETYLLFKHEKLFIKSGDCRRIDASNFTKAIHDQIALLIGIDDRYFWSEKTVKKEIPEKELFESCTVLIFSYEPKVYRDC